MHYFFYQTTHCLDSALAKDKDMLDEAMLDDIMHARSQLEAVVKDKDTIGGIPLSSNFPNERQSLTSSRSPCKTALYPDNTISVVHLSLPPLSCRRSDKC
jgi:hypothetical protein